MEMFILMFLLIVLILYIILSFINSIQKVIISLNTKTIQLNEL